MERNLKLSAAFIATDGWSHTNNEGTDSLSEATWSDFLINMGGRINQIVLYSYCVNALRETFKK